MPGFDFDKTGVLGESTSESFSCNVWKQNPDTPDRVRPDVRFERQVYTNGELRMPDGQSVEIWGFEDSLRNNAPKAPFPSPLMRVRRGQVVHSTIRSAKNTHTIHHHGMNPTTFNDGVGHVSFEVSGRYTYQFQPQSEGTYFYHCHKNTVLHFEMGMYGPLIVDPPEGPGRLFSGGPAYQVEAIWVPDDLDPAWRGAEHDAGLCGEDANLDLFRPKYFVVSGAPSHRTMTDPRVRVTARVGQTILLRVINAAYGITVLRLGLPGQVFGVDGRALGRKSAPWSRPFAFAANQPIELVSAQRLDLIVPAVQPGIYPVTFEFRDWVTGAIQNNGAGVVRSVIEVI